MLTQFGRRTTSAQNLVVVHSELGSAPAIARAIDRTEHARVVGTLAGDDTCLVITRDEKDAKALAAELAQARVLGGFGETVAESHGRAGRRAAASSVAPIAPLSGLPASLHRDAHRTRCNEHRSAKPS